MLQVLTIFAEKTFRAMCTELTSNMPEMYQSEFEKQKDMHCELESKLSHFGAL